MAFEDPTAAAASASNEHISRASWVAVAAAIAMMACLCGLAAGSIMVSAGVATYAGLSGVAITEVAAGGPTYTALPTYTLPPTYTPLPTHTSPVEGEGNPPAGLTPTAPAPSQLPPAVIPASPYPGPGDMNPAPSITEDVTHVVQPGDTLESIAGQYGVDVVPIAFVNELDLQNPQMNPGTQLIIPARVSDFCVPENQPMAAEVVRVISGDTIEVSVGGQPFIVSYIGISSPEAGATAVPFSEGAMTANQELVEGQTVSLIEDVSNADDAGTLPRYVLMGSLFINYEIVRGGFGEASPLPPDVACDELFALAEEQARLENVGLWATGTPPAPPPGTPPAGTPPPAVFGTVPPGQATPQASVWTPPPTLTATSTSSLGFSCHCLGNDGVWGNFYNQAQGEVCQAICRIQAERKAAACATAMVVGGSLVGCR